MAEVAQPLAPSRSGVLQAPPGRVRPKMAEFLRACAWLGATGFGGGLAILAQAGELFEKRRWLTEREWVHTATVAQILPGGAATNALSYVGLRFFGAFGAAAAVAVYVSPSMLAMIALALAYGHIHQVPQLTSLLAGFNAAVVGLVVAVTWRLGQGGLKRRWQAVLAALALASERLGHATVLEVIVFGILAGLAADSLQKGWRLRERRRRRRRDDTTAQQEPPPPGGDEEHPLEDPLHPGHKSQPALPRVVRPPDQLVKPPDHQTNREDDDDEPLPPLKSLALLSWAAFARDLEQLKALAPRPPGPIARLWAQIVPPLSLAVLFTFARVGAVAYGGGFTIVPLLEREAVQAHGWITPQEFADAIAFGQVTPGPVLIAASFIGARTDGVLGGLAATIGVFGVPVVLTVLAGAWLDRWRRARMVKAALRGLVPAVVGMMAAAALALARAGIPDETGIILAIVALIAVVKYRLNPALVVVGAGALRVVLAVAGGLRV